jgi:uncharacterized membrane protein
MEFFRLTNNIQHRLLRIGIFLKGVEGVLEILGGLIFFYVHAATVTNTVTAITQDELTEEPGNFIANFLLHWSQGLTSDSKLFIALFLLVHGLVNLILVLGLMRRKIWAYPSAMAIFIVFVLYQIYRFINGPSFILSGAIIFDVIFIALIAREYRHARKGLV